MRATRAVARDLRARGELAHASRFGFAKISDPRRPAVDGYHFRLAHVRDRQYNCLTKRVPKYNLGTRRTPTLKPYLGKSALIRVGVQTVIESDALDSSRGVVFEDDGETGYFYARDYAVKDQLIADALHIYTARTVSDAEKPVRLRILWDAEWLRSALLLEDVPHAMFDFAEKCGYSKDPFPEPSPESGWRHAPWHNDLRKFFYD